MEHILDTTKQSGELHAVFKQIQESNTILFLGAGASVGEKKYLSKEIISYYEAALGRNIHESNITKFVDILSADENFSRTHFDNFVIQMLQKLKLTEAHKILATIPWRQIITTNYDLLVERAYNEITQTSQKIYDLKVIRNIKQYSYRESNTEVKFIKLNGCIQDSSLYNLAFSSDDFNKLKQYYKGVLNDLKNLSPAITFLSIGYSFSDDFGKELLDKFDSYNYRDKKWMINVDPYPNDNALAYYKQNKVCIVKCSFEDFFMKYKEWDTQNASIAVKKKGLSINSSEGHYISMPPQLLLNLEGGVRQLNSNTKDKLFIREIDFYKGEEPTFNLITRGVDVVKSNYVTQCQHIVEEALKEGNSTFIPIFFITGDFGIGKSTFCLRFIYELEKNLELDLVAFEITDFNRIKKEYLIDLVNLSKSKNLVFFCDEVEVESYFKSLLDIQRELSIEQFQDCNVIFIVPIRENILEKYKLTRSIPRSYEVKIDGSFESIEVEELLEKLKKSGLIEYRDASEKKRLLNKIQKEYGSDSFISLMGIITSGKHENDLISCYHQLSGEAQKAFLYTALIHRYKLSMPAGWLKQNISLTWDEFITKIVKAEGKGILIQEVRSTHGTQPDLYFRTKHPLIAARLVDRLMTNRDQQFSFYERMLKTIEVGQTNSYLVNNLLKAFVRSDEYSDIQLNKLFDAAYTRLGDDPYFLLNYAINLQGRNSKTGIKKALELLVYAESLLDFRNHRFIHCRAVLNFELAKIYFKEESVLNYTSFYYREAEDLFRTKQLLDPFSAYSYVDYIKMLIWELEHIDFDDADAMQKQILIEELFDLANRTVTDELDRIDSIYQNYANYLKTISEDKNHEEYLSELYANGRLRPYTCILLYNYYQHADNLNRCNELIDEMEEYQDNFEVVKFLFKIYGRKLYDPNVRIKLQRISRDNPNLEKDNPLRYNYFNFMAESYNYLYLNGRTYINNIKTNYYNLNPEFHHVWCNSDGLEAVFDAQIVKNSGERFKAIKISTLQLTARLIKGNYEKYKAGDMVKVKLHFYLYGLMAEIIP